MNIRFYHAKILLTKADHTFEVTEGELWVRGDHICYIGDGTDTSAVCKEDDIIIWDREINAKGNLLMPGFKNAHTHTPMTFLRSFADDLPLQEWLQQKVFPNEARLKGEDTYWLAILGIMEYLTSGITSNFDMYIMQDYHINAYVDTGFRTVFTSGLNNFTDSLEVLEENYLRINGLSDLTSYVPGFHAEYTTSRPLLEGVAKIADKYHAPVWTHNSETEREVAECKARWGMTPMQFTESLGLYEHGGGGYHCVWLEEKDIEILKKHHMSVVTNPGSNTKLASGICPVKRLLDEGINLATVRGTGKQQLSGHVPGDVSCDRTGKTQGTGRFLPCRRRRCFIWRPPEARMRWDCRIVTVLQPGKGRPCHDRSAAAEYAAGEQPCEKSGLQRQQAECETDDGKRKSTLRGWNISHRN